MLTIKFVCAYYQKIVKDNGASLDQLLEYVETTISKGRWNILAWSKHTTENKDAEADTHVRKWHVVRVEPQDWNIPK